MKYTRLFRIRPESNVRLKRIDPDFTAGCRRRAADQEVARLGQRLRELQYMLYADGRRSLLICLQGRDASGKDGTINHVLGSMNPQGARVHGFKVPSVEEAAHDFLWRIEQQAPKKGEVVIFNRSHYEDVLAARVHKLVPKEVWKKRFDMINDFERRLAASGTRILKFFLHISPEEQLARFHERLADPARHWKISESDYAERELWDDYTEAYEDVLTRTSTDEGTWFVIPANNKWFRNLAVANIVSETMIGMDMKVPEPTVDMREMARRYHKAELNEVREIGKQRWFSYLAEKDGKATAGRRPTETRPHRARG